MVKYHWTGVVFAEHEGVTQSYVGWVDFHHNPDYSGNVLISVSPTLIDIDNMEHIPFAAMEAFVLSKMRADMIEDLKDMSDEDFARTLKGQ